jgi:hypothetical protein
LNQLESSRGERKDKKEIIMSYYGKSLYLDFDTLPRANHRFSLGRVLAKGTSASIYHGVDHEAGI